MFGHPVDININEQRWRRHYNTVCRNLMIVGPLVGDSCFHSRIMVVISMHFGGFQWDFRGAGVPRHLPIPATPLRPANPFDS
jgi:hypothetical protein